MVDGEDGLLSVGCLLKLRRGWKSERNVVLVWARKSLQFSILILSDDMMPDSIIKLYSQYLMISCRCA